jgi:hypothetical protein
MRHLIWLLFLLPFASTHIFMVVRYDSANDAPKNIFNFSLSVVGLNVSLLGCDYGYYDTMNVTKLECRECICSVYSDGRHEPYGSTP